ncbi:MAG: OsmC family protein, partial [Pseudorhodoplanes sp.]
AWLKHPKSFMTLDNADHLLRRPADAAYAAQVIAAWADRYIPQPSATAEDEGSVRVSETGGGAFQQSVALGRHFLIADEPRAVGGLDSGASPYQLLLASLGACTAMTLRMYAARKGLPLERVSVELRHHRTHKKDGEAAAGEREARLECIERIIGLEGDLSDEVRLSLLDIAERCPVHRTLSGGVDVNSRLL